MTHLIAAIKLGTDPVAPLPAAAFHRTLEDHLTCPKCDATYSLVVDYDWAVTRHFPDESRPHIALLKRTIRRGHDHGHHITHFETNGVMITHHQRPDPPALLDALTPLSKHIH